MGFFHHIGSLALFLSFILLLVTVVTAPVAHNIAILTVSNYQESAGGETTMLFGTFGYCVNAPNGISCNSPAIGYSPLAIIQSHSKGSTFSTAAIDSTAALTRVMALHPLALALSFLAFLFGVGSGVCGSLLASLAALLAFAVTVISMIADFVLWGTVKNRVNGDASTSVANYAVGSWTLAVAAMAALVGAVLMFLSCCAGRARKVRKEVEPMQRPQQMGYYPRY